MPLREDLTYEKRETKTPYISTGASDIDDALDIALSAVHDAQKFREYAKATGTDVVMRDIDWGMAAACFACGAAVCLLALWFMGVI